MKTREFTASELWQTAPYNTIMSYIKHGANKAIHKRDLVKLTKLDERILRKHIETIRRNGMCILSGVNGYYYPLNRSEVERYIRRTERTAKSHFYTLRAARAMLEQMDEEE